MVPLLEVPFVEVLHQLIVLFKHLIDNRMRKIQFDPF